MQSQGVFAIRAKQVEQKQNQKDEKKRETVLYDAMWAEAREAEALFDKEQRAQRIASNVSVALEQRSQAAEAAALRAEAVVLRQKEREIALREAEIEHIREQAVATKKRQAAVQLRADHEEVVRRTLEARSAEVRAELASEIAWIARLRELDEQDAAARVVRRESLKRSLNAFFEYLERQRVIEARRQAELEKAYGAEQLRAIAMRVADWDREANRRRNLLNEVLRVRVIQLAERREQLHVQAEAKLKEHENLVIELAKNAQDEATKRASAAEMKRMYHEDLTKQVSESQKRVATEAETEAAFCERQQRDLEKHEAWVRAEVENMNLTALENLNIRK